MFVMHEKKHVGHSYPYMKITRVFSFTGYKYSYGVKFDFPCLGKIIKSFLIWEGSSPDFGWVGKQFASVNLTGQPRHISTL